MDRAVFDNEKFISLIEPNSCLWNTSHEDYFDRNKKQRCWVEIAKQMCNNFEEMTSVQQNEYGKYIFITCVQLKKRSSRLWNFNRKGQ